MSWAQTADTSTIVPKATAALHKTANTIECARSDIMAAPRCWVAYDLTYTRIGFCVRVSCPNGVKNCGQLARDTWALLLWRDQGEGAMEARELLSPIYGWFTEGFDTPNLKEANKLLGELAS